MSFNMHNMSVNVDRVKMIESIKAGLALHEAAYNEAFADFKDYALAEVNKMQAKITAGDFSQTSLLLSPPTSHVQEYHDAIEIFSMSVDSNINIDLDTFNAYFKNKWKWSHQFEAAATLYKTAKRG